MQIALGAIERVRSTANLVASATVGLINAKNIGDWGAIKLLYNSMVHNASTYCLEIWELDFKEDYDKIQSNFYKILLRLPKSCPLAAIRFEFRLRHSALYIIKQIPGWLEKVYNMNNTRWPKVCLKQMEI